MISVSHDMSTNAGTAFVDFSLSAQRHCIVGFKSFQILVNSDVPQDTISRPLLFDILIND
jgi:hypothetical protein